MFSTAALLSLVALAIVIVISCFREEWNPGLLGIFFALLVGTIWGEFKRKQSLGVLAHLAIHDTFRRHIPLQYGPRERHAG